MTERVAELLRSRRLAVVLLVVAGLLAAAGTLLTPGAAGAPSSLRGAARLLGLVDTHRSPLFLLVVALTALNLALCTWHRAARAGRVPGAAGRRRPRLVLDVAMHLALLVILAGGAGKALWGTVRTKNIHVGGAAAAFYDFTKGADVPLGFRLEVLEREETWYPLRAMIGVSEAASGSKLALAEAVEGRTVDVPAAGISLRLAPVDAAGVALSLAVRGRGTAETVRLRIDDGTQASAEAGPLRLTLVAWRRDLKGVRGRVACAGDGLPRREGWISPQDNLVCAGVSLALTAWGIDEEGLPFVGIQAVRDPAAPLFWGGCAAFALLLVAYLVLRAREPGVPGARSRTP